MLHNLLVTRMPRARMAIERTSMARCSQCRGQVTKALNFKLWGFVLGARNLRIHMVFPPNYFSLCTCMNDEDLHRLNKDSEINNKRTSIDISHIKHDALLITDVLTPADLPQTSNAGFHRETF